jgi:hypothetical protein
MIGVAALLSVVAAGDDAEGHPAASEVAKRREVRAASGGAKKPDRGSTTEFSVEVGVDMARLFPAHVLHVNGTP